MYRVQEGKSIISNETLAALTGTNYLKSAPSNPAGTAEPTFISAAGTSAAGADAALVVMPLATNADAICNAISKQTNSVDTAPTVATAGALPTNPTGCFKTSAVVGALVTGTNYAYARI
ncbi:MAG: hypothetical protein B7X90_18080 [Novosphingobium sp. 17-62-19]|nr:MAG: hypothetical protein B7X90_18080 [Novosphingobium sp. 17-62-19]